MLDLIDRYKNTVYIIENNLMEKQRLLNLIEKYIVNEKISEEQRDKLIEMIG